MFNRVNMLNSPYSQIDFERDGSFNAVAAGGAADSADACKSAALNEIQRKILVKVSQLNLHEIAIFVLELHKPLCGLVGGCLTMADPFLRALVGPKWAQQLAILFESPQNIESLIAAIEKSRADASDRMSGS